MSVLVLLAHPDLANSRANRALADAAMVTGDVEVHDLYGDGPGAPLDVAVERAAAETAATIVLQFPLYWYSAPPRLKLWLDEVLTMGWAYGVAGGVGMALEGRRLAVATTTGAPEQEYSPDGWNGHTIEEYLRPFEGTARFCAMSWVEPFVLWDVYSCDDAGLAAEAARYASWLSDLGRDS